MNRISLQMYTMREHMGNLSEFEQTIEKLSEIGFETIEYGGGNPKLCDEEVLKIFAKNNMKTNSIGGSVINMDKKKVLKLSEMYGTKAVGIESIPYDLCSAGGFKMFAHYINEVGADLKKEGIKLMYHFHSFEFIRFGEKNGVDILLEESDPEILYLEPDTHWAHSGGKDPADFIAAHKDRILHVHCKDYGIGRRNKNEGILEDTPKRFAEVGEGNLDWGKIIPVCKSFNVPYYVIEQDFTYGKCPFECVKTSFNNLVKFGVNED